MFSCIYDNVFIVMPLLCSSEKISPIIRSAGCVSGTTKRDFIDNQQEEGNIFQLVDAAMSFFFKHLNLSGTTHNRLYREDELEIPYDALRESIVNAYCHMNWGYEVATVGLAIYDDRIEIENAGRFPARISPDAMMRNEEIEMENP